MKLCLNQIKCGRLNLVFSHDFTRLENMFKFKDRQPKHLQKTLFRTKLLVHAARCILVKLVDALKQESASI